MTENGQATDVAKPVDTAARGANGVEHRMAVLSVGFAVLYLALACLLPGHPDFWQVLGSVPDKLWVPIIVLAFAYVVHG